MIAARQAPVRLSASTDWGEVLKESRAVISTTGMGGRRAWEQDVFRVVHLAGEQVAAQVKYLDW